MFKRVAYSIFSLYLTLFLVNSAFGVNLSRSAPRGIWQKYPVTHLAVGDYVAFCPKSTKFTRSIVERGYVPEGYCHNGGMPLLKQIAAMAGDTVQVTARGVRINRKLITNSAPLNTDSKGRKLPQLAGRRYLLRNGELWLRSLEKQGLDSRYLGKVSIKSILNKQVPLWIYQ